MKIKTNLCSIFTFKTILLLFTNVYSLEYSKKIDLNDSIYYPKYFKKFCHSDTSSRIAKMATSLTPTPHMNSSHLKARQHHLILKMSKNIKLVIQVSSLLSTWYKIRLQKSGEKIGGMG